MHIDHYMVDFEDEFGRVNFANDTDLHDLAKAKKLAKKTSEVHGSACVIAYTSAGYGAYLPIGDIEFYSGEEIRSDGIVA